MAEKFPALDNEVPTEENNNEILSNENSGETDFLQREADLLGDEFKTEQDADLLGEAPAEEDDDEFDDFASNSNIDTTINEAEAITSAQELETTTNTNAQETINQWRESYNKEIQDRDEREAGEKDTLQKDAINYIDEFYDNYDKKKQEGINTSQAAAKEFIAKRDQFFQQEGTTTWDRAFQLINEDDAAVVGGRDRTKFKEILQRLQGKVDAPGA